MHKMGLAFVWVISMDHRDSSLWVWGGDERVVCNLPWYITKGKELEERKKEASAGSKWMCAILSQPSLSFCPYLTPSKRWPPPQNSNLIFQRGGELARVIFRSRHGPDVRYPPPPYLLSPDRIEGGVPPSPYFLFIVVSPPPLSLLGR